MLKKIEPGMVVHCSTIEQVKELLRWAHDCGFEWRSGNTYMNDTLIYEQYGKNICYIFSEKKNGRKIITWNHIKKEYTITEYSELLINKLKNGEKNMLKKIEPRMVIHCGTKEQAKELVKWGYECGFEWSDGFSTKNETFWETYRYDSCYLFSITRNDERKVISYADTSFYSEYGYSIVEYSDLLHENEKEPEKLSASELIEWFKECNDNPDIFSEVFGKNHDLQSVLDNFSPEEITEKIALWKKERNTKKEPEIETVDICRIIKTKENGYKCCVHEEEMLDHGIEEILKRYCMEHDGEFIAVRETICRVKK